MADRINIYADFTGDVRLALESNAFADIEIASISGPYKSVDLPRDPSILRELAAKLVEFSDAIEVHPEAEKSIWASKRA